MPTNGPESGSPLSQNQHCNTIRVVVVDDHALFRKGVIEILQDADDIEVVGEAENGFEAISHTQKLHPDVLVMDLAMPVMNGMEATERLRAIGLPTRILILTVNEEERSLFDAFKSGAQGYVVKTVDPDELLNAVRRVAAGETVVPSTLALKIWSEISRTKPAHALAPIVEHLTDREMEVLRQIGTGASNHDIAENLHISGNTVRNHVRKILSKLHVSSRIQAATYAVREGLLERNNND